MTRPYVLILEGGRSVEYEVSLRSSLGIQKALRESGYQVGVIRIEKDGSWSDIRGDWFTEKRKFVLSVDPHAYAAFGKFVVFPVLHGPYGEDGTIQGALELANVPYVGCGVLASALGMHKGRQKELFTRQGLQVAPWISCTRADWQEQKEQTCKKILKFFSEKYPLFVKPICTGSSVGISKVQDQESLMQAIDNACTFDGEVIIETGVYPMREIEVAILGATKPESSVIGEIIPDREFYDYDAKYSPTSKTALRIDPDDIDPLIKNEIRLQAVAAFKSIGCSGLARVDFFLSGKTIFINEINTMPGFTTISMYPKLWEASGVSFGHLCEQLIIFGQEVWKMKQQNKTSI